MLLSAVIFAHQVCSVYVVSEKSEIKEGMAITLCLLSLIAAIVSAATFLIALVA